MSEHPENSEDSIREQLDNKYKELRVIAAISDLKEKDMVKIISRAVWVKKCCFHSL